MLPLRQLIRYKFYVCYLVVVLCLALVGIYLASRTRPEAPVVGRNSTIDARRPTTSAQTRPLVTLFTAFADDPNKSQIRYNALRNWSLMRPEARLIWFVTPPPDGATPRLAAAASFLRWDVVSVRRVSHSGAPFVGELYRKAMAESDTPFYAFASADILFNDGFLSTLRLIDAEVDFLGRAVVVTGCRTEADVADDRALSGFPEVTQLAREDGRLLVIGGLDYFVTTRSFPWQRFRDIPVGRATFDNYIVGFAVANNVTVVDATKTILALHQSKELAENTVEISIQKDEDQMALSNDDVLTQSNIQLADYETVVTSDDGQIELRQRKKF